MAPFRVRRLLGGLTALLLVAGGGVWLATRGEESPSTAQSPTTTTSPATTDLSARFARYKPASEPNGDASKVEWPDFVSAAGPEVKRLYAFQIENGELMRYMPCFCGCGQDAGHRNNRDCYVKRVNSDGTVVLDPMAPT